MAKSYYTVADLDTGDVLPETWIDQARENMTNLIVPPACRVYAGTATQVAIDTLTILQFESERFDTDSMHSTSTNTSRITCNTDGIYDIRAHVEWDVNATDHRATQIMLNGSTVIAQVVQQAVQVASTRTEQICSAHYALVAGDYVQVCVFQSGGSPLSVTVSGNHSPEFSAVWLGRTSAP